MQAEELEEDAPVQAKQPPQQQLPPPLPEVVDDSATWRRRYEHLAGLLAELTKARSEKVSMGDRRERCNLFSSPFGNHCVLVVLFEDCVRPVSKKLG